MDEDKWPDWSYDRKSATGQFLDGPGWIKKLTVTGKEGKLTVANFYDGHTSGGKHLITVRAPINQTRPIDYEIPFKVHQGLYMAAGNDLECVSVQYRKDKP